VDIKSAIEKLNTARARFEVPSGVALKTFDDEKNRRKPQYPGYERLTETEFPSSVRLSLVISLRVND
jgi:hypothetical protein